MTEWIGTKTAVRLLGVSPTTIRRWADDGVLPFIRTAGGHRRFKRTSVEALISEDGESLRDTVNAFDWVRMLRESDVAQVREKIRALVAHHDDWFTVADFLGLVTTEIGRCWADNEFSTIDEHIATARLHEALSAFSSDFAVTGGSSKAVLATFSDEFHTLGLALTQVCLRSIGIGTEWIGANTPVHDFAAYLRDSALPPVLVALSASDWSTDGVTLRRASAEIGSVCESRGIHLVMGGQGAWPEAMDYGHRFRSFSSLRSHLNKHGLPAKT